MSRILEHTLDIDDKIDLDAERDTREVPPFVDGQPPHPPLTKTLALPSKPGWTWLLKGRLRRWEVACHQAKEANDKFNQENQLAWERAVQAHEEAEAEAKKKYSADCEKFYAEQQKYNDAIAAFRTNFEAGDIESIKEYCSRVLERSDYPEQINISHTINFDTEANYVLIDIELPNEEQIPIVSGYKFIASSNTSKPIPLKKKEAKDLYNSVLSQIVIRTIHEVFEGCYIDKVAGVILNGWVTSLNRATGQDERKKVHCVAADRETFESFDLSRVDPAACIAQLAESVGHISGATG